MGLVKEHIYKVRTFLQKYMDENKPSNRFIHTVFKDNREAMYYSHLNDKGKLFNSSAYTGIDLFPMIDVDRIEVPGIRSGQIISRSRYKLPKLIDTDTGIPALRLFSIESNSKIDLLSIEEIIGNQTRKYQYPETSIWRYNDYLYSIKRIAGVKPIGIWRNPEEADFYNSKFTYDNCGNLINESCPTPILDTYFPVSSDIANGLELKTAKDIAMWYGVTIEDVNSNQKDESAVGGRTVNINRNNE